MKDIIIDALIDSLKLLPFLFVVYLIMEILEHKSNSHTEKIIKKSGKFGPIIGSVLGIFPQCGFSVMASNLYIVRVISLGTLISIYLSTSDEMLPILLSSNVEVSTILKFLLVKLVIGMLFGLLIDLFVNRKKQKISNEITKICEHEHCHCDENIWWSATKHTFTIFIFVLAINLGMDILINLIGEDKISSFLINRSILGPIVSGVIGFIPNCASSVIITELYLNNALTCGSAISGLLCASGLGVLVLFKMNKNYKENILIVFILYTISVLVGIIFNVLQVTI